MDGINTARAAYYENLERILARFPEKEMLSKSDVQRFTGLNYRVVSKLFPFRNNYISAATLALFLS